MKQAPVVEQQAAAVPVKEKKEEQQQDKAKVSGAPIPADHRVIGQEEKVEYRDQDGNLLDEEQVNALKGKVEFKTKYETRTRVVDENGNELQEPEGGWPESPDAGVAPPHPDVEGANSETVNEKVGNVVEAQEIPASKDGEKEAEESKAKPASDHKDATVKEEL